MFKSLPKRTVGMIIAVVAVVVIAAGFAFEPITRSAVAVDGLCLYCHVEREYVASVRLSPSTPHPPKSNDEAKSKTSAEGTTPIKSDLKSPECVDCHLPTGFVNTIFAYTHFASITDFYGHLRDRKLERSGPWLPPRQAAAYRVRDRLYEYDSPTCRTCHIEAEIKPKRERGKNAHELALKDKKTCIECHTNENHRFVDVRADAFGAGEG